MVKSTNFSFLSFFKKDTGSINVCFPKQLRLKDTSINVAFGGKMDHCVDSLHGLGYLGTVGDIAFYKLNFLQNWLQIFNIASKSQSVNNPNFVIRMSLNPVVDKIGANKPCPTGD